MTDQPINTSETAAGTPFAGQAPEHRVSSPEVMDWHMILDHELDQLSQLETGVLGSIGFMGLGGAIGLAPPFVSALSVLKKAPATDDQLTTIIAFAGCVVLAVICLGIFALHALKNRGLKGQIRKRPKHDWSGQAQR